MSTIAIGCDHAGVALKAKLVEFLKGRGCEVLDVGSFDASAPDDYTDFAVPVCEAVLEGKAERGVLLCTTGIGMSIIANRFTGIRAAIVTDEAVAKLSREHNDANVFVLSARALDGESAVRALTLWLDTPFSGAERHVRRLAKCDRAGRLAEASLLAKADPEVHAAIVAQIRQEDETINLIASENYTSPAVREAQGSVLTNKYAEGYPGKRFYNGCLPVDAVETLAIERVKQLFGAEAANVQPHCGSAANMAIYNAFLKPGDTILSMSLDQGGHLSTAPRPTSPASSTTSSPTRWTRRPSAWTTTPLSVWRWSASRASSSPAPPPIRAPSTSRASVKSPTRWAPITWSTWRTSPDLSPAASIPAPCPTPTS